LQIVVILLTAAKMKNMVTIRTPPWMDENEWSGGSKILPAPQLCMMRFSFFRFTL
jgi:hypothetical protein